MHQLCVQWEKSKIYIDIFSVKSRSFWQFYLVTGGSVGRRNVLDSTEIYSGVEWSIVESAVLPYGTEYSQITNFNEKILLFGKYVKYAQIIPSFLTFYFQEGLMAIKPFMTLFWSSVLTQRPGLRLG